MINYFKSDPTTYVMLFRGGTLLRQGLGASFFHMPALTSVVAIPTTVQDAQYALKETTADHQEITIQGDVSYRISRPETTATLLDFRVDPRSQQYLTQDPEKIRLRLIHVLQAAARTMLRSYPLEDVLGAAAGLSRQLLAEVQNNPSVSELGVSVDDLRLLHVTPTAETRKALEADFREQLNKRADQAIYARRKAALDEERTLQETEMATETAMEEKRRNLVEMQASNSKTLAEADAAAEEMRLAPYKDIRTQALAALALNKWAESGANIGQLNLSPDLVGQISGWLSHATTGEHA